MSDHGPARPENDSDASTDPLGRLRSWWEQAREIGSGIPDAISLATVTPAGLPANRIVIAKRVDDSGVVFVTSGTSAKGRDLAAHPEAAAVFLWPDPLRQVRVSGPVEVLDDAGSDELFASHAPLSRAGFVASRQSEPMDPDGLERLWERIRDLAETPDELARPATWHGYRLVATAIEFWSQDEERTQTRVQLTRATPADPWQQRRVQP
ncbi:pyridoxal 5'-phosphate synthase [Tersicoccus sp. Bi-70]|uniref:pyridoxine/pyridoxamine 5'-phosphate oxidase n=1 Tax=Tersicoccus sp. Bi-70 TaxID=1897634 RepID=UPI0009764606|nr:pyridoxal 5'-phosphate synthase [Tersicoccus sp. Bi-70]OMH31190.1 hypothetical protein BGP79_09030 [Tersicoccus sp. Bi-70]